jgi:hypothetical protein
MGIPGIAVDFNEMLDDSLCLLSRDDEKVDSSGARICLSEGLTVHVAWTIWTKTGNRIPW